MKKGRHDKYLKKIRSDGMKTIADETAKQKHPQATTRTQERRNESEGKQEQLVRKKLENKEFADFN